jgi:hypothetical protein
MLITFLVVVMPLSRIAFRLWVVHYPRQAFFTESRSKRPAWTGIWWKVTESIASVPRRQNLSLSSELKPWGVGAPGSQLSAVRIKASYRPRVCENSAVAQFPGSSNPFHDADRRSWADLEGRL